MWTRNGLKTPKKHNNKNVYLIGKSGKASPDCLQIPSAVTTNDACVKAKLTPAPGVCAQVCKF